MLVVGIVLSVNGEEHVTVVVAFVVSSVRLMREANAIITGRISIIQEVSINLTIPNLYGGVIDDEPGDLREVIGEVNLILTLLVSVGRAVRGRRPGSSVFGMVMVVDA